MELTTIDTPVCDLAVGDRFLWLGHTLTIRGIDCRPSGRKRPRKNYTLWVDGIDWDYVHYYGDEVVPKVHALPAG